MDLIFMLTRDDLTVADCLEVMDEISSLGVRHLGFKDVGVPLEVQRELLARIKASGATSYFEVVSETPEACLRSARAAVELGVDCLLGGTDTAAMAQIVAGTGVALYPFCGFPQGHPTRLGGSPADIARHCREMVAGAAAGVDLLAFRATDADPVDLIRAAREALAPGRLIVAGSIDSPQRVRAMADLGVDGITIGTALFQGVFAPVRIGIAEQLRAALDCAA
ncbi:MAG: hypothetical protein O3B22_08375 [Proteobacteria bacterium]|nr:hypothetical protein [Pseudomonadota bacterium]MDA0951967.1 hypothetical protein [Pseudomonadota bacterium]